MSAAPRHLPHALCCIRVDLRAGALGSSRARQTRSMSTCGCAPATLTSVAFANGVVLQRCRTHEVQTWTGGDRATSGTAPLPALKDLFVQERGHGKRPAAAARRARVARPAAPRPAAAAPDVRPEAPSDDLLTALLNARGLSGAWTVAPS
jgi:hypothetical protein